MKDKEKFVIGITKNQWAKWNLDDPERYIVALSAFYCGYGVQRISDLVRYPSGPDAKDIVRVAPLLGLSDEDEITIINGRHHVNNESRGRSPN